MKGESSIKKLWKRIIGISADPSEIFIDFLAFAASLGFIAYAGGFVYLRSFFDEFSLTLPNYWDVPIASTTFVTAIILKDWMTVIIFIISIVLFALVYFLVRHIFTNWFGYILICIIGSFSIVISVAVGEKLGSEEGKLAWNSDSSYPRVTLTALPNKDYSPEFIDYAKKGMLKLLYHDDKHYYLYLPKSEGVTEGIQPIFVVNRLDFLELRLAR